MANIPASAHLGPGNLPRSMCWACQAVKMATHFVSPSLLKACLWDGITVRHANTTYVETHIVSQWLCLLVRMHVLPTI